MRISIIVIISGSFYLGSFPIGKIARSPHFLNFIIIIGLPFDPFRPRIVCRFSSSIPVVILVSISVTPFLSLNITISVPRLFLWTSASMSISLISSWTSTPVSASPILLTTSASAPLSPWTSRAFTPTSASSWTSTSAPYFLFSSSITLFSVWTGTSTVGPGSHQLLP